MASVTEGADKGEAVSPDDSSIREATPPGGSSDGEGSERTTREKLKKTSIAGLHQHSTTTAGAVTGDHPLAQSITVDQVEPPRENGGLRGRPSKKRSFEDLQKDEHTGPTENGSAGLPDPKRGYHKRMRSRDVGHGDESQQVGRLEEMGSPLKEESDDDAHLSPGGPGVLVDANPQSDSNVQSQRKAEEKILQGENTANGPIVDVVLGSVATAGAAVQPPPTESSSALSPQNQDRTASTLSPPSGFANVSSTSPFGAVKSHIQPPQDLPSDAKDGFSTTSSSAFASSGLSAFASSEKSPFGAASTTRSSGGFGDAAGGFGGGVSGGFGSGSSTFGSASAFGAKASSGFGVTGGFGSAGGFGAGMAVKPFGAGISSFGGPAASASAFGKPKPFGANGNDEDEDGEEGEDGEDKDDQDGDTKQDSRFHEQEVETGEEDEEVFFQARARLYHFEKEWKERGTGNIKINVHYEQKPLVESDANEADKEEDPEDGQWSSEIRKARVVMRADGVHRVILNSPVFKGMKVGTNEGKEPIGRTMYLTGLEDGQPRLFQIRIGKEEVLKELYRKIQDLKEELEG